VAIDIKTKALTVVSGALGFVAALTLSAPTALADPMQSEPVMPVASSAAPVDPVPVGPAPSPAPAATRAVVAATTPALAAAATPTPAPAVTPAETPPATPVAAPADPAIDTPAPTRGPAPDGAAQPAAVALATPPDGVPHLSSPENLPPGTTDTPPDNSGRGVSYLRDLWHAVQTQEVSGKDALLLLTQRPMNANAVPPPGMPASPTPPTAPLPPEAPLPADAPPVS
jgi:hypothetical protein